MEALGPDEELAAVSLGANGWQMFWHVTVPNIKWGLVYGIILCNGNQTIQFTGSPGTAQGSGNTIITGDGDQTITVVGNTSDSSKIFRRCQRPGFRR